MNNKNKKSDLQFTKLTPSDVTIHEDLCIELLMGDKSLTLDEKGGELAEAKRIFCKTFE